MKNKKLKIAIVSKLWEPTSPLSTGGTGMSVGNLVNGLVKKGHQITLFASGNSKTNAQKIISVKKKHYKNDYSEIKEYQNIANAFKLENNFDIIHTHVEHKSCFFAPTTKTPTLISIRYGEFFKDELNLLKENKKLNFCFNSNALKQKLNFLNSKGVVYNGINLELYEFNSKPSDYFLYLGRITPQKGVEFAIKLAKKNNLKLILAGKLSYNDQNYFDNKIKKHLNKNIQYLGEVKFKEKIKLLSSAKALINPTRYFEACSNVILESQACGTPVITFDKGSNKEIIKNNQTGFVVKTEKEMHKALQKLEKIDRLVCRKWIENNFSSKTMVIDYEKIYYKLINQKR